MTIARAHAHALTSASTVTNTAPLIRRPTKKGSLQAKLQFNDFPIIARACAFGSGKQRTVFAICSAEESCAYIEALTVQYARARSLIASRKDSCFGNALKLGVPLISGIESGGALRFRPICTDFAFVLDSINKKTYLRLFFCLMI